MRQNAFEGLNMKLYYHTKHQLYGSYATEKVKEIMLKKHWSEEEITEAFHKISEKTSKILLVLIIPLTELATWLVSFKKRKICF